MRRFLLISLGVGVLLAAALAPTAGADPVNAPNGFQLQAVCNGTTYQVVGNGNGKFSPAHIVDSTAVFIPYSFDLTFTSTSPTGETVTDTETSSKAAPLSNPVTCTIPAQSLETPEGTVTIQGSVTGALTPR
jgi:hypothetical protein